jgi:hypothetical protein
MAITNQSKPTTSLVSPVRMVNYETWDSNTSTWDTETRTWDEMGTIWSNQSSYQSMWSDVVFPWNLTTPWFNTNNMSNVSKP